MRRKFVLLLVLLQLLVLGYMAGKREYIVRYGQTVYLRTAPIDPRDPFRGDFVRLRYEFNWVNKDKMKATLAELAEPNGSVVYASLKHSDGGLYELDTLTDKKPKRLPCLKGRIQSRRGNAIQVRYGIEQYFTEQGKGRELEQTMGSRNEMQIPLEIEAAIGWDGSAVIKGYRWSKIGIKTEIIRFNRRGRDNQPQADTPLSPKLKITLQNVSEKPLFLANPGDNCGFTLHSDVWAIDRYRAQTDTYCNDLTLKTDDLISLQPDQSYTAEMDLAEPRWHVSVDSKTMEIGRLEVSNMFRLVYHSPARQQLSRIKGNETVWLGRMPGRAFNASGRLD